MTKASLYNKRWREKNFQRWKEIQRVSHVRRYARHGDEIRAHHRFQLAMISEFCRFLKEDNPCVDCGRYDKHYVMEWDHRSEVKNCSPGAARNWAKMWRELAIVDLVCVRCHSTRTWARRAA